MKIKERKIELKTVSLKIIDDAIEMSFTANQVDAQPQQIMVNYDADQTIGENLENIRVKLVGIQFDAIVIENPLQYPFSDTIVGLHH